MCLLGAIQLQDMEGVLLGSGSELSHYPTLKVGHYPSTAVILRAADATGNQGDGVDSDAGADYPPTHAAGFNGGRRYVQRRGRRAHGLVSLALAAVLVAACGGGGSGGGAEPHAAPGPPPDGEPSGYELTTKNATSAATSALALVANAHSEAEYAVFFTNALAVAIAQGGAVALSCGPDDPGRPPTVHWQDANADARLSPGDAVVASGGTCGDQTDARAELDVTAYASDELGIVELRGELEFSMSVAPAGQPATSTEGSLTLDYAAPEGRIDVLLSDIELVTRTDGATVSLSGGLHALKFDHAKQTRTVSFSGEVENDGSGETFRFDTPVPFEHDWRTHPSLGELVVRTGRSTAKVATLPETRRRAWASLAVDRDASGNYDTQTELRWDDLADGESQLLFDGLFGFAGALRGFFLLPFGPETHKALDAYAEIPRDNLPESGTVRYEWYRNGQRVPVSYPDYYLPARETTKGDFIEAKLLFSSVPDATRTASATVRNSPPELHVVLSPEGADTADDIVATVAHVYDWDGDAVELRHEWLVNEIVVEDVSGDTLPADRHERGDRVTHTLFADDGEDVSEFATTVTVADAEPRLLGEVPLTVVHGHEATFEVVLEDPDGDPVDPGKLRVDYGPPGMSIDGGTGRATFVPTMPLFDRAMDFHWQIGSSEASVAPLTGTVTVVDEEGGYPLFRTRLQKPIRMSVDDLDGDGDEEALVLGKAGPHVLEWNGEEYVQSWAYPLAHGTEAFLAMTHADIDGDGRHEIFVATERWSGAGKIIQLGGADRRFVAAAAVPSIDGYHALECRDIDVGDLDGDGVWELACLTSMFHVVVFAADDLTVLWNSEQAEAPLHDGVFGWDLAVGNVDEDGSLEIVTSTGHVYDGASRTLEWSHERSFSKRSVSLGDLDGDGIQEIIGNGVFKFGDGPLDHPARSSSGYERARGAVADTNGDGREELVWWDSGDDLVLAVYQYTELAVEPELLYEIPLLEQVSPGFMAELPHEQWHERLVAHVAAGDLDGDGHEEVVLAGPTYHAVVGFDGGPEFEWLVADVRSAEFRGGVFEADQPPGLLFIARSGEPKSDEIWCPTCRQAVMRLPLHPRATPTLAPTTTQPSGDGAISRLGTVTDMVAADVDGDGRVEVTVALLGPQDTGADAGRAVTSLHTFDTSANEWTAIEQLADLGHAGRSRNAFAPWRLALGDVNGDGHADLLAGGAFPDHSKEPHIVVFDLFSNEVLFETDFELEYDGEYAVAAIAGADLNGDGRAEIIVAAERESHSRDRLFAYSQQGESMEFKRTDYDSGLRKIYDIAVSDFDGDGQPELALLGEPVGYGSLAVTRLSNEFEELNHFVVDVRAHTTRRLLVPKAGRVGLGRRTVLFVESEGESWNTASTVVAGFDVIMGNRIWESPKLLGLFRDIAFVHDGDRPRWVVASSYGMHVTR